MHQLPQIIWLKQCYYSDITEILDWLARGIRLLFLTITTHIPWLIYKTSSIPRHTKFNSSWNKQTEKQTQKHHATRKKIEQLVDFAHWNYLFLNCAVMDTNYPQKKKKKEHYISLHKPCWRDEEEEKKNGCKMLLLAWDGRVEERVTNHKHGCVQKRNRKTWDILP